jgi:hypothetical protein
MTLRSVAAAYVMTQPHKNAVEIQILLISVELTKLAAMGIVVTLIVSSAAMAIAAKTGNAASMASVSSLYVIIATR